VNEISGQRGDTLIERLTELRDPRTELPWSGRSCHEYGKLDDGVRGRGRIATATLHSIAFALTRHTPTLMPLSAAPQPLTYKMLIYWEAPATVSVTANIVLPTASSSHIAPKPISPDIGEYRPIPNTPIPVSFEPYAYLYSLSPVRGPGDFDAFSG